MPQEEKLLKQRHQEWIDIVNQRDVEAYVHLLTEDVVWFAADGEIIESREAFRKWVAPFFSRFDYDFKITNEQINFFGDRAVEKADFISRLTPVEGGDSMEHRGTFTALWRRESDGVWRIERYVDDTDL